MNVKKAALARAEAFSRPWMCPLGKGEEGAGEARKAKLWERRDNIRSEKNQSLWDEERPLEFSEGGFTRGREGGKTICEIKRGRKGKKKCPPGWSSPSDLRGAGRRAWKQRKDQRRIVIRI